jgi:hypothetical protein
MWNIRSKFLRQQGFHGFFERNRRILYNRHEADPDLPGLPHNKE